MKMAGRCKNQTKNAICEQGQFNFVASLPCRGKREQKWQNERDVFFGKSRWSCSQNFVAAAKTQRNSGKCTKKLPLQLRKLRSRSLCPTEHQHNSDTGPTKVAYPKGTLCLSMMCFDILNTGRAAPLLIF